MITFYKSVLRGIAYRLASIGLGGNFPVSLTVYPALLGLTDWLRSDWLETLHHVCWNRQCQRSLPIGFDRISWKLVRHYQQLGFLANCLPIGFDRISWKLKA